MNDYESGHERRRYPRYAVGLRAGIQGSDGAWYWHDLVDVSASGLALPRDAHVPTAEDLPVHVERVGGGRARVARTSQAAVCLEITHGDVGADLRNRRIEWHASNAVDQRRHRRVRPAPRPGQAIVVPIVRDDGRETYARLQDVSAGGLSVCGVDLPVDERVEAGGVTGVVVRSDGETAGIAFDNQVDVGSVKLQAARTSSTE